MSSRTPRWVSAGATAVVAAVVLTGCAGTADAGPDASGGASSGAFPVTLSHLYGETTLEEAPERVATWGWGATDAVLALGVMPVAIPSDEYGGGEDRITPWVQDAIDEIGGEAPVILDNSSYTLNVEELLATDPDVLVASYSGLTQEEYDAVTGAGIPVVAPKDALWSTPWRDVISETGTALGLEAEADAVLEDLDAQVSEAAAAHPEFAGTTVAWASDDVDTFYLYLPADSRVEILEDLGFVTDPSVLELDAGESTFYTTVSAENLDKITAEVIFSSGLVGDAAIDTFLTSERTKLIPAVAKGAVAIISGVEDSDAVSPTALTLPYILPKMVDVLAAATAVAQG